MSRQSITTVKYPTGLRILHWTMALLILGQIFVGWFMTPYDEKREPLVGQLYYWHKSFGLLLLMLAITRLAIRLRSNVPQLPGTLPLVDRVLAHSAHRILYAFMILSPITGYVLSSTYEFSDGIPFFGLQVPELFADNHAVYNFADRAHAILGYSMLTVVGLHIAGAIKHRFFDDNPKNDVLSRML